MRLSSFAFLIGIGKAQDFLTDIGQIDVSDIGNLPFDFDLSQLGQICEPTDGDYKSVIDGIKDVIGKIDEPLTKLMMNTDFEAFTLIDSMKIFEAILKKLDKNWCNKFLDVLNSAFAEQMGEVTMQQIKNGTRDIVGTIMNILRSLGVNAQVDRLVAMAELEKAFVLGTAELKELLSDDLNLDFWQPVEGIVSSIDFNAGNQYTASPADNEECRVIDEIIPWVETAKPLVLGLISDFYDAFRGKEGLLSIGKMAFFEYRLAKHLLFNKSACEKLMDGASGIFEELATEFQNVDLTSIVDLEAVSGIFEMIPKAASENSMTSDVMKLVGDFAKSETPPTGAKPLTYDIYKMTEIGKTAIEAAPKMMNTIKFEAGPIMEKAGMQQTEIQTMLDAIKEEDVKSFATEMSAELSESNNEMICGGKSTCEDLVSFKAQVAKENEEAGGLPGNGSGKTFLSFGATCTLLTILSFIYA